MRSLNRIFTEFSGLYAITPTYLRGEPLIDAVKESVSSGIKIIQYRFDQRLEEEEKLKTATKLLEVCDTGEAIFIINNDYNLANELGAGLHIGQDIRDTAFIKDLDQIRLIGLSCKDDHLQQSRKDHALFSYFSFVPK